MKKKTLLLLTVFALAIAVFIPVGAEAKVKISKKSITMTVGQKTKLKVKGTKKKITWKSKKKAVATVNKKGKVTAKKAGKTTIIAKVGKKKYKCKVIVKPQQQNNIPESDNILPTPEPDTNTSYAASLAQLTKSILRSAYTDYNGNPVIQSESSGNDYENLVQIAYDSSTQIITFRYRHRTFRSDGTTGSNNTTTMTMHTDNNISVPVTYVWSDRYGFSSTYTTNVIVNQYRVTNNYQFSVTNGNYSEQMNSIANQQLREAFNEWDILLIRYGLSLNKIGWISY